MTAHIHMATRKAKLGDIVEIKTVLKGAPHWVRYLVYGFLAYAVVNFMIFFQAPTGHDDGANPPAMVWCGFSGHWMVFYLAAFAILYSASRQDLKGYAV